MSKYQLHGAEESLEMNMVLANIEETRFKIRVVVNWVNTARDVWTLKYSVFFNNLPAWILSGNTWFQDHTYARKIVIRTSWVHVAPNAAWKHLAVQILSAINSIQRMMATSLGMIFKMAWVIKKRSIRHTPAMIERMQSITVSTRSIPSISAFKECVSQPLAPHWPPQLGIRLIELIGECIACVLVYHGPRKCITIKLSGQVLPRYLFEKMYHNFGIFANVFVDFDRSKSGFLTTGRNGIFPGEFDFLSTDHLRPSTIVVCPLP